MTAKGATAGTGDDGAIEVRGHDHRADRRPGLRAGIRLHELAAVRASLEEAFMELTAGSVEYQADVPAGRGRP